MSFRGMRFCQECDNMLQPKEIKNDEGSSALVYDCRTCGFQVLAIEGDEEDNCVYKSEQIKLNEVFKIDEDCIKDPCLARRPCDPCKCGNTQAVTFTNPSKDRMNLIFVCTRCKNSWRKEELDQNDVPFTEEDLKE